MSSDSQDKQAEVLRELRQFTGLGASFFRAAAARIGMTVTDMQVLDILEGAGPSTAGQLADLTGLTTGAITGMLNRLEESGHVRRERDPNDGRRVIVQLVPKESEERAAVFSSLGQAWDTIVSQYDEAQIAFLLEFLRQNNAVSRREIVRLREAPTGDEGIFSAPLDGLDSARLVIPSGILQLVLRARSNMSQLYQATFEGPTPDVKVREGVVTIRYPRRLWLAGGMKSAAEVTLNTAIPWQILIQGGAAIVDADLGGLKLAGLEVKGGLNSIHLQLPTLDGVVPIKISGGASDINVHRPTGVAARAHLKGWVSTFIFDDQIFSNMGNDVRLQSSGYKASDPYYDIEVSSSASMVTITTD